MIKFSVSQNYFILMDYRVLYLFRLVIISLKSGRKIESCSSFLLISHTEIMLFNIQEQEGSIFGLINKFNCDYNINLESIASY